MALSTGSNKIKTAIFISGTGSNLKSLIKFSKLKKSPIIIKMIISNNSKAKGLQYSKIYKIKKKVFNFKNTVSEKKIINELRDAWAEMLTQNPETDIPNDQQPGSFSLQA